MWGLISGDWYVALGVGVFFELFTIDIIPVGTVVSPNALFPLFWIFCVSAALDIVHPAALGMVVLISLPLMQVGGYMEKRHRAWQIRSYTQVLDDFRKDRSLGTVAGKRIIHSMGQLFTANFLLFLLAGSFFYCFYAALAAVCGGIPLLPLESWGIFWFIGVLGAFLAIRTKPGYAAFGVLAIGIIAYAFLGDIL